MMTLSVESLRSQPNALDDYIRDNILLLNDTGIKTYWCCSGLMEDHIGSEEQFSKPNLTFGGTEVATPKRLWICAYLVLDKSDDLPLVHGWMKENSRLNSGPKILYRPDEFFEESDNCKYNDVKLKILWDRLFDFIFEYSPRYSYC